MSSRSEDKTNRFYLLIFDLGFLDTRVCVLCASDNYKKWKCVFIFSINRKSLTFQLDHPCNYYCQCMVLIICRYIVSYYNKINHKRGIHYFELISITFFRQKKHYVYIDIVNKYSWTIARHWESKAWWYIQNTKSETVSY